MRHIGFAARLAGATSAIAAVAAILGGTTSAAAQERPASPTELPPVPTSYDPGKTAWGDPNISHSYQIEYVQNTRILFQRPVEYGNRYWQTQEEHDRRVAPGQAGMGKRDAPAEGRGAQPLTVLQGVEDLLLWPPEPPGGLGREALQQVALAAGAQVENDIGGRDAIGDPHPSLHAGQAVRSPDMAGSASRFQPSGDVRRELLPCPAQALGLAFRSSLRRCVAFRCGATSRASCSPMRAPSRLATS